MDNARAQPAEATHELLEQLGHEAVDYAVQQRVREQSVTVPAEVSVHARQDAVRDAGARVGAGTCAHLAADLVDALRQHRFEDAEQRQR